jgi:hypothetical protein
MRDFRDDSISDFFNNIRPKATSTIPTANVSFAQKAAIAQRPSTIGQ